MARKAPDRYIRWLALAGLATLGGCGKCSEAVQWNGFNSPSQTSSASQTSNIPQTSGSAQSTPSPPKSPPARTTDPAAAALVDAAIVMVESTETISAKVRQDVLLFGKRMVGSGSYAQQRTEDRTLMRWEMRWQHGDRSTSWVQVADGEYLWSHDTSKDPPLSRVDLRRAARWLAENRTTATPLDADARLWSVGLARLLRSLRATFDFRSAEPGRWGHDKRPVWRVIGTWHNASTPVAPTGNEGAAQQPGPLPLASLPNHVPTTVVLLLGQNDMFPYRIEYRRDDGSESSAARLGRLLVSTDFHSVNINVEIPPERFAYQPGDTDWADPTEAYAKAAATPRR